MKCWSVGIVALWLAGCGQTAQVKEVAETKGVQVTPEPDKVEVPPPAPPIVIPANARLTVRTTTEISTRSAVAGEAFTASVAEAVVVDGKVIIPKGASVSGLVDESDDGGRVKGVASLSLRLTHVTANGKRVPIQSSVYTKAAPATKKKDAVKVGIAAGIGAAVGAIAGGGKGAAVGAASGAGAGTAVVLATHGDPAVIDAESILSFRLAKAVTIQE